jgi:hypothetical protein
MWSNKQLISLVKKWGIIGVVLDEEDMGEGRCENATLLSKQQPNYFFPLHLCYGLCQL